ncbi:petrobactin biosynthesis protein AsbD [Metabacillus iocasae]|uniref:Acyl carrier protein n=1 Tax=Priestia iocasae TaxID=2291674 RepID=A0ABS2QYJ5_9BACI|nr:petrobactin biosynthesis protein AsbD [Metabacillus iocasae]MBM7704550.1 acyl carrier protein [Metabacillus iocasae]
MTREELTQNIYDIMKNKLELPTLSSFQEHARLNEDLYMDSIMILQLLLHVELDLGLSVPDEVLSPKDFHTVGTLIDFLERLQNVEENA